MLARLDFQVWGRCLEVSRILLWTLMGVFRREVAQELPRVLSRPLSPVPNVASGHLCFSRCHLLPVKNSGKQSFFLLLVMMNIKLTGDKEINSWERNRPARAGQLWRTTFHSPGKTLRGQVTLFSLCRQHLT